MFKDCLSLIVQLNGLKLRVQLNGLSNRCRNGNTGESSGDEGRLKVYQINVHQVCMIVRFETSIGPVELLSKRVVSLSAIRCEHFV